MREPRPSSRRPSPFTAAVLSLIFPGLGHLYLRRLERALAFAALPILGLALLAGVLVNPGTRQGLLAGLFSPAILQPILVLDVIVLVYRLVAVVDAYRSALGASGTAMSRVRSFLVRPASAAGLAAVLVVLSLGHVVLARYDRIAYDTITAITSGGDPSAIGVAAPTGSGALSGSNSPSPAPSTPTPPSSGTPRPPAVVPWNGTDRLNVLLVGTDQRPGDATFNTDTMIVASIDPTTGQVAMFSVPRDTENVPLPPGWPAHSFFAGGVYPNRINSIWSYARASPLLFDTDAAHAYTALEGALGQLLGIDIRYYVEVNFDGFIKVVDTLGGAMIDVQVPVADYHYPIPDKGGGLKLYVAPGIQYMTGAESLAYARSRHETNDFDRAARQQRVIVSLREQTDVLSFLDLNKLDALSGALRSAIHTDFPAAQLPSLITLMERADLANLRSFVFTPPRFETECAASECLVHYWLHPKVDVIQQTVRTAFTVDPALERSRKKLQSENATVWVLGGSSPTGRVGAVADYLDYLGVNAVVPPVNGGRADRLTYPGTVVTFYNGAEATMPETVRSLEAALGVSIATRDDPTVHADVIVITGKATPSLQVPIP